MSRWEKIWKYGLVFILIHMSSGASAISLSNAALAAFSALTLGLAFLNRVKVDKHFYTFTFIYVSLSFFYMMQFGWLNFTSTARLYLKILYAYFTIKLVAPKLFETSEDIIGKLAIVSLPLFALQLFFPDLMMSVNGFTEFIIPQVDKGPGVDYSNSIIYTVNPWGLERNSGFMWEPGAFAAMLSIGAFLNMVIYNYKRNWKLVCMIIALFTTQSTTGYALVGLLGVFWLMNQSLKAQLLTVPLFVLAMAFIFTMPSVTEKVIDRTSNWDKTIENQDSYADEREGISVGRIGSFYLDWNDLQNYPLIGYGQQQSERTTGRYVALVRANGLSDYMVRFGLLGMVFLIVALSNSFYRFGQQYEAKGLWVGTALVLTLAFSNPLLMTPFFLMLQFYFIAQFAPLRQYHAKSSCNHSYV